MDEVLCAVCVFMVWLHLYALCTVLLVNSVSTRRERMRDQKRGQESDMKWKRGGGGGGGGV